MPLLSVIIPTYNASATLKSCLNSVLNQKFKNIEIIVMDSDSSDDTVAIVKEFITYNTCIKLISEKDKGIYDAMNKGIELAAGDWLYFLGSDDCLRDMRVLSDVAKVLESEQVDLIYGDSTLLSNNVRRGEVFNINKLLIKGNICHQAIFYHRRVFDSIGKYNLDYPIVADWDLNIRCFSNPNIKTKYFKRDIVLFNDITGISSTSKEDPFFELVPLSYILKLKDLEKEKHAILMSLEFRMGSVLHFLLKKIGIIQLLKKLR